MASKKPAGAKLPPPMFPRVVVRDVLENDRREALFREVERLVVSGVPSRLFRAVQAERGVWLREGKRWSPGIQRAARSVLGVLQHLELFLDAATASLRVADRAESEGIATMAIDLLQGVMDGLYRHHEGWLQREMAGLAGLNGCGPAIEGLRASSALEAGMDLAWCLRTAVTKAGASPFAMFGVMRQAPAAMRSQVGRQRPDSVNELQRDDRLILAACEDGEKVAKSVARETDFSVSHVTKRKGDLTEWGFLEPTRPFRLSMLGRRWLQASRESGIPRA